MKQKINVNENLSQCNWWKYIEEVWKHTSYAWLQMMISGLYKVLNILLQGMNPQQTLGREVWEWNRKENFRPCWEQIPFLHQDIPPDRINTIT